MKARVGLVEDCGKVWPKSSPSMAQTVTLLSGDFYTPNAFPGNGRKKGLTTVIIIRRRMVPNAATRAAIWGKKKKS